MADARKLFRQFKWLQEYQKAADILEKPEAGWDMNDQILNLLTRAGFFGFFFFDNLFILAKLKFLKIEAAPNSKRSCFFWWLGLLFNTLFQIKTQSKLARENSNLKRSAKNSTNQETYKARFAQNKAAKIKAYRTIIRNLGDWVVSGTVSGVWGKVGVKFGDTAVSLGGTVSSVINTWELYK